MLPVVAQGREASGFARAAQDLVAAEADADVGTVLGGADELRGLVAARRFARYRSREVHDVVIEREPSVRLRISRTAVQDETLRVDEPLKFVQEQAALGVEGRLTVLEGSVDAPVSGRKRARQAALGGADVVRRERTPMRQNECRDAWVRPFGRRRAVSAPGLTYGLEPTIGALPGSKRIHAILEDVIRRRFAAGKANVESLYEPLADAWALYESSGRTPGLPDWSEER